MTMTNGESHQHICFTSAVESSAESDKGAAARECAPIRESYLGQTQWFPFGSLVNQQDFIDTVIRLNVCWFSIQCKTGTAWVRYMMKYTLCARGDATIKIRRMSSNSSYSLEQDARIFDIFRQSLKKVYPKLCELAPAARGRQDAGSHNLEHAFLRYSVAKTAKKIKHRLLAT